MAKRTKQNPLLLSTKERANALKRLLKFGETVWASQRQTDTHGYRPRSSYFSQPTINAILDAQLTIKTLQDLSLVTVHWPFLTQCGHELFCIIKNLNTEINDTRAAADQIRKAKSREAYAAKKALVSTQNRPLTPPPTVHATRKRPALQPLVNAPSKRAAQPSATATAATFRPQYKPRARQDAYDEPAADENTSKPAPRRSARGK